MNRTTPLQPEDADHRTGPPATTDGRDPVGAALASWIRCCESMGWRPNTASEDVHVTAALGRVTSAPVWALVSSPAEPRSAMDGIAVRATDTVGADEHPVRLLPEQFDVVDTGDRMPAGRDAVVMYERLRVTDDGRVVVHASVTAGRHVRPAGEDIAAGEFLLPANHRIRAIDAATVAAGGHTELPVRRKPRVGIIPTGDEVRTIGSAVGPGEVLDTNSLMLSGMVHAAGGVPIRVPVVPDDPASITQRLLSLADMVDLVLVIAGSSKGRDDHTAVVLESLGRVAVHGVAMRPGHPVALAALSHPTPVPVVGIPGYPLSAARAFDTFATPMIAQIAGVARRPRAHRTAVLDRSLRSPRDVDESVLVRLETSSGAAAPAAVPVGRGASATSSLMRADGMIRIPVGTTALEAGATVSVEVLAGAPSPVAPEQTADAEARVRSDGAPLEA